MSSSYKQECNTILYQRMHVSIKYIYIYICILAIVQLLFKGVREEKKNKPQHSLYGRGCKGRGYFVLTGTRTNT